MRISQKCMLYLGLLCLCFVGLGMGYAENASASTTEPENVATVSGKVLDREGLAVKDATVQYLLEYQGEKSEKSVKTDDIGSYSIVESVQENTRITILVKAEGYITNNQHSSYMLSGGEDITLDFHMYEPSTIVGTVTDSSGTPIVGARVKVKVSSDTDLVVKTDWKGRYNVSGIDCNYNPNITLWIDDDYYMPYVKVDLNVQEGETSVLNVALESAAYVRGKVVDEAGKPISNAKVNAGGTAITDAYGNYFIKRVPVGDRTIVVEVPGYLKSSKRVILVQGNRNTHNIILKKEIVVTSPVTKYRLLPITDTVKGKSYIKGFTLRLQATDGPKGLGVKTTQYRINGVVWMTYEGPVKLYAPEVKMVEYFSTDNAGNKEKYNKMDFIKGTFEGAGSF